MIAFAPTALPISTEARRIIARGSSIRLGLACVGACLAGAVLVVKLELGAIPALLCLFLLPLIVARPIVGLLAAYAMVLAFETQSRFDPLMLPGRYFHNGLGGTLGLTGVIVSPLELVLILVVGSWAVRALIEHRSDAQRGTLFGPMVLFGLALVAGLVRGAMAGGSLYIAFWEVRALVYIVLSYIAAANLFRTPRDLRVLLAITLIAPGLFAIEGIYRRVFLVERGLVVGDLVFDHDDPVFLGAALLVVLGQLLFGGPRWRLWLGILFAPLIGFTLMASERRAGMIGLLIALVAVLLVLLMVRRRAFVVVAGALLLTASVYLPLFWNSATVLGQPARAIRSLVDPNDRDASSNWYRDLEKINVGATIAANPVLGVGFGREFLFVVPLPTVRNWELLRYEPHHNILWIWLKLGAAGFVIFWVLIGSALARAAHLARVLRDPDARTFAVMAMGSIVITLCYAYVDTALVSGRITLFLGTLLGTLAVLERLVDVPTSPAGVTA